MLKKITDTILKQRQAARDEELYRNLMRHEAKIGGQLFGAVPEGHRREFFCLDKHTWIWHEEWTDENGKKQIQTTRYDVRPNSILKAQDGQQYQKLSDSEVLHLREAAGLYLERIRKEIYDKI